MRYSIHKLAFNSALELIEKVPLYLREQFIYQKSKPDFKILSEQEWEEYKTSVRNTETERINQLRYEWLLENVAEKDRKRLGITVDGTTININFEKFPVDLLNKLNNIK